MHAITMKAFICCTGIEKSCAIVHQCPMYRDEAEYYFQQHRNKGDDSVSCILQLIGQFITCCDVHKKNDS